MTLRLCIRCTRINNDLKYMRCASCREELAALAPMNKLNVVAGTPRVRAVKEAILALLEKAPEIDVRDLVIPNKATLRAALHRLIREGKIVRRRPFVLERP